MNNLLMILDTPAAASASGGPTDPITTATEMYTEVGRKNDEWLDEIGGIVGFESGGGQFSLFTQTQNSLEYYETDASGSSLVSNASAFLSNDVPFSACFVIKVRATGAASDEYVRQSGENANATWRFWGQVNKYPEGWIRDKNGEVLTAPGDFVMTDNVWRIFFMTANNVTGAGELKLYNSAGVTVSDTNASWVASNYNGTSFCRAYGTAYPAWTGLAELGFWNDRILTLEEVNSYGQFLASKWDISWTDNT